MPRDVPRAIAHLRYASNKGQTDAHALLGFLYASGMADRWGVPKSLSKSLMYWTFSAAGGNVYASTALGYRYIQGIGVVKSCETAAKYYQRAAHTIATDPRHWPSVETFMQGRPPLPSTLTDSGRMRVKEGMISKERETPLQQDSDLIEYYRHSAQRSDTAAMITLAGLQYFGGYGLQPDQQAAREMLERAARIGNGDAHGMLGHMQLKDGRNDSAMMHFRRSAAYKNNKMGHYALGFIFYHGLLGQQRDYSKAAMHFTLATEHKHAAASFHLGLMHWTGQGVEKDYKVAYHHFQEGARLGSIQSMLNVGTLLLQPSEAVTTPSCDQAVKQFKRVAEAGEWANSFQIAGDAVHQEQWYPALYRYMQAAYAGIEIAQYNAGMLLELLEPGKIEELQHWDRERVLDQADEVYEYSGRQGYEASWIRSGNLRYIEQGDYRAAADKYEHAAHQQSAEAMVNLAFMHARGIGFDTNRERALEYLTDASIAHPDGAAPAQVARIGLRTYWTCLDMWRSVSWIFAEEEVQIQKGDSRQAIGSGETTTGGVNVKNRMVEWEELALLGALVAVLLTVLVVRSKRLARQHALEE